MYTLARILAKRRIDRLEGILLRGQEMKIEDVAQRL